MLSLHQALSNTVLKISRDDVRKKRGGGVSRCGNIVSHVHSLHLRYLFASFLCYFHRYFNEFYFERLSNSIFATFNNHSLFKLINPNNNSSFATVLVPHCHESLLCVRSIEGIQVKWSSLSINISRTQASRARRERGHPKIAGHYGYCLCVESIVHSRKGCRLEKVVQKLQENRRL